MLGRLFAKPRFGLLLLWLVANGIACCQAAPSDWDYQTNDPAKWPSMFKRWCGGRAQSPIELSEAMSTYDADLPMYSISEENLLSNQYYAYNDGHKISILFTSFKPNVTVPGHSDSCFRPHSVHWHWGASDIQGAEHVLEGRKYPLEGHIVMWNCQFYDTFEQALGSFGGLAVLGTLYEPDASAPMPGPGLSNLMTMMNTNSQLQQCSECRNESFVPPKVNMPAFSLSELLPADRSQYFLYSGSLTTPDCRENVMWTVYRQSVRVPPSFLSALRSLRYPDGAAMVSNFRPPQPLNPADPFGARRTVVRSYVSGGGGGGGLPTGAGLNTACPLAVVAAAVVALVAAALQGQAMRV